MKKIKIINSFIYKTQFGILGANDIESEFDFSSIMIMESQNEWPDLIIEIKVDEQTILDINLFRNDKSTKRFYFNSLFFSNEEIMELSKEFGFQCTANPYFTEELQGSLTFEYSEYKNMAAVAKKYEDQHFLVIYASKRSAPVHGMSDDMDDTYYIHGIWEVKLSVRLQEKLFS